MHAYSTLIPTDVSMSLSFRLSLGIFLVALLFAGCGGSQDSSDLGEWTLDTEALTLTEKMKTSGTENYFFGHIEDLAVTSDGRMIVSDTDAHNLKVLRPDGTLIDTVGREGQGPGEFQSVGDVHVGRGDSLYVTDISTGRLSVFAPDSPYEFERVLSAPNESSVSRFLVLGNRYAGMMNGGFSRSIDERSPPSVWCVIGPDGTLGDTLLTARQRNKMMTKMGGGFVVGTVPFSRMTIVTSGPDNRIYHAWTDSLHIESTTLDGQSVVVASIPAEPVPVRSAERDSVLAKFDGSSMRSEISSAMPDTKPALTRMLVADDGRVWVKRPAQGFNPDSTTWWRLLPDEKTIQAVTLPSDVSLHEVQEGKVYGVIQTETEAPAVVRYRVRN